MALVGPNGAGKSTLLRILGTTVLPDAGSATVGGYDVSREDVQARRSLGLLLTEDRSWYWRLSARENLLFFSALHQLPRRVAVARIDELLFLVGLDEDGDRPVAGFSSGMRVRLALARAMLSDPAVLLLDEPTRSLDPPSARRFGDDVLELAERGRAILMATHDLREAERIATRAIVLQEGRVTAVQSPVRAEQLESLLDAADAADAA